MKMELNCMALLDGHIDIGNTYIAEDGSFYLITSQDSWDKYEAKIKKQYKGFKIGKTKE